MVHVLLKPGLENFEHTLLACEMSPTVQQFEHSGLITSWKIGGETVETTDFILGGSKITADGDSNHEIKMLAPWKESHDQPRQHIKQQRHYFANKGPSSYSYGFSSSHVWM